jgi:TolB protein
MTSIMLRRLWRIWIITFLAVAVMKFAPLASLIECNILLSYAAYPEAGQSQDIFLLDLLSGQSYNLTRSPDHENQGYWSPDGRELLIIVSYGGESDPYLLSADGRSHHKIAEVPGTEFGVSWSPDGQWVAFVSTRPETADTFDLHIVNVASSSVRYTVENTYVGDPSWSPDSVNVIFASRDLRIQELNTKTGLLRELEFDMDADFAPPQWTPDGDSILFRVFSQPHGIYIGDVNTGATRQLAQIDANSSPQWSPDGRRIAVIGIVANTHDLFALNADGSNLTNVTNDTQEETNFTWLPNSEDIIYATKYSSGGSSLYRVNVSRGRQSRLLTRGLVAPNSSLSIHPQSNC